VLEAGWQGPEAGTFHQFPIGGRLTIILRGERRILRTSVTTSRGTSADDFQPEEDQDDDVQQMDGDIHGDAPPPFHAFVLMMSSTFPALTRMRRGHSVCSPASRHATSDNLRLYTRINTFAGFENSFLN